ncbi:hypothetical protein KR067_012620 [Drosophila pandora]|nr:hypothetical protein KR067_012620 [Drosophila pandora]
MLFPDYYRDTGIIMYTLLLSLPIRIVLYAAYLYLQNLSALLKMIELALILILAGAVRVGIFIKCRIQSGTGNFFILPEILILRMLFIIYKQLNTLILILQMIASSLRIPGNMLNRLSKFFRDCANRQTWIMMLHHAEII